MKRGKRSTTNYWQRSVCINVMFAVHLGGGIVLFFKVRKYNEAKQTLNEERKEEYNQLLAESVCNLYDAKLLTDTQMVNKDGSSGNLLPFNQIIQMLG